MTRTFILLCTGVFAIAYALYELKHMGVYYPDASNPQLFTGWKAVTELGPAILATGIAATEGGRRGAYRQTKCPYQGSQHEDRNPAQSLL